MTKYTYVEYGCGVRCDAEKKLANLNSKFKDSISRAVLQSHILLQLLGTS